MNESSLSARLKNLRQKKGLSLSELARRVDTSVATLSRYENGWDRFEVQTLNKIATALGATLSIEFKIEDKKRTAPLYSVVMKKIGRLFWDHKLKKSDFKNYPVWLTERVIEYGSLEDVKMILNFFGRKIFLKNVALCRFGSPKTEYFWRAILKREGVPCTKRPFPREARRY